MKRKLIMFLTLCLVFSNFCIRNVQAEDTKYSVVNTSTDVVLNEFTSYESALSNLNNLKSANPSVSYGITLGNKLIKCDYGVARISGYFNYVEADTKRSGYGSGGSGTDAAYISTSADGKTIRIKQAGQVMDVATTDIMTLVDSSKTNVKNYYMNSNGYMTHYYYSYSATSDATVSSIRIGPSYAKFSSGVKYYSYDGHYFYTNYNTMIDDYRSGVYTHSINNGAPYYNYYQYLSHRTASSVSSSQIDDYIVSKIGSSATSTMYNTGSAFLTEGNKYTVNPLLMFGLALYESGYGRSAYAINNNNLFGHGAFDNTPAATKYSSVDECIAYHAYNFLSSGYLNAGDSRYRGSHYGDKQSGMNVKYASTPYWGEIAASVGYYLGNDYGKYTLGLVNGDIRVYKEASTSSTTLYSTGATGTSNAVYNVPVVVLSTVTGTDGNRYYKVMCDTALNSTRTKIDPTATYDANRDYGYILASQVSIIFNGTGGVTSGTIDTPIIPSTPSNPTNYSPTGVLDAVVSNEAGKVTVAGWAFDKDGSSDSISVKVYIGNTCLGTLNANQTRADVNAAYGISGSHGYSGTLSTTMSGSQTVTVKAVDLYTNKEYSIGAKTVTIKAAATTTPSTPTTPTYTTNYAPQGTVDLIQSSEAGKITVAGWVFDKDSVSTSLDVKIYIGSTIVGTMAANQLRTDVNNAYGITGSHGYSGTLSTTLSGSQTVTVKAVDLQSNTEYTIGSKTITIKTTTTTTPSTPTYTTKYTPQGCVDLIQSSEAGKVYVAGWAFDKDSVATSIDIKVYIGSTLIGTLKADQTRADVNNAFNITGSHGYSGTLSTTMSGSQTVTIKAVDLQSKTEYTIGSKTITIKAATTTTPSTPTYTTKYTPTGVVDLVTSNATKSIYVAGWAFDKDSVATSISIKVYIGSSLVGTLTANQTRADVNTAYGITGSHGYSGTLSTTLSGMQTVTIKAVDLQSNTEYTIGTKTVTIK